MIAQYITETDLKARVPNINDLYWDEDTDFNKQKTAALEVMYADLRQRGFDLNYLQSGLTLQNYTLMTTGTYYTAGVRDFISRGRLAYDVIAISGTGGIITLQGSFDNSTWIDVKAVTITALTTSSVLTEKNFTYYRLKIVVNVASTLSLKAFLIETLYDLLLINKWLEIIHRGLKKEENDVYHIREKDFRADYDAMMRESSFNIDLDEDGEVDDVQVPLQLVLTR